jgi:hypothetical protein
VWRKIRRSIPLGEGWHNNHHYYQGSANQRFCWWEIDVSYYLFRLWACAGLVWDVRRPPPAELLAGAEAVHSPTPAPGRTRATGRPDTRRGGPKASGTECALFITHQPFFDRRGSPTFGKPSLATHAVPGDCAGVTVGPRHGRNAP